MQKRPAPIAFVGFAVLIIIAVPMLSLRLGSADASNDKAGTTTKVAYDLIAKGFGPGANGPILVVAKTPNGSAADMPKLLETLRSTPGVAAVTDARPNEAGTAAHRDALPDHRSAVRDHREAGAPPARRRGARGDRGHRHSW